MFNRNGTIIAAALAATFATTTAHAVPVTPTLTPDSWGLDTSAQADSNMNPSVPNTGTAVTNIVTNPTATSGSQQSTAGASAKATMSLQFAPAGIQGQATATADNIQTIQGTFDSVSAGAEFKGDLALEFMVVGPAFPLSFETVPIDIQGVESVRSSAPASLKNPILSGTHATASVEIGGTTITVSSFQGSTKNTSRSFNVQSQVFPNTSSSILMTMDGLANSTVFGGKAGGTVSASAEIDPFIYIDTLLFAEWYPGIDPNQYSVAVNSEFLNIPPPTGEAPLPAALPLFATGLGALGLLGWRKKRKAAA